VQTKKKRGEGGGGDEPLQHDVRAVRGWRREREIFNSVCIKRRQMSGISPKGEKEEGEEREVGLSERSLTKGTEKRDFCKHCIRRGGKN